MTVPAANVLIVIPRNQFAEDELFPLKEKLEAAGCRVWVLSRTGKEALGMNKTKFQPDGMLADWNKQEGVPGKYDAVIVTGGKGAPKTFTQHSRLSQEHGVNVISRPETVARAAPSDAVASECASLSIALAGSGGSGVMTAGTLLLGGLKGIHKVALPR